MKHITVVTTCDYPNCDETPDIETSRAQVWVYMMGRGRKPKTITVDLCPDHRDSLKQLFSELARFDQSEYESERD